MKSHLTMLGLLALALMASHAGSAAEQDAFAGDQRLNAPVTVVAPLTTLERALSSIKEQCGVDLTASPEVSADTVIVIVRNRPAKDLMRELALSLGYSWSRKETEPPAYRLFEPEQARAKASTLRRQYRRAAAADLDQQLALTLKYVDKYRAMEPRDVLADIQTLRDAVTQMPVGRERLAAEWESFAAERANEPTVRALLSAYAAIPPATRDQIVDGRRVLMASARPGDLRIPVDVLAGLRAAREFEGVRSSRGPERPVIRQTEDELIDFIAGMRYGRLVFEARTRRLGDQQRRLSLSLPRFTLSPSQVTYGAPLADNVEGRVTADRPPALAQRVRFGWQGKPRVKTDPLSYCRGILLSDVVKQLANQEPSLQFVGDAYFNALRPLPRTTEPGPDTPIGFDTAELALARLNARAAREGQLPLELVLRELAIRGNTNVHVASGGWVRLRSTVYFNDRAVQLDPKVVQELYQPVASGELYSRDVAMRVAQRLTYQQVDTLTSEYLAFLPELRPVWRMRTSWDGWRLLGALTEDHRNRLLSGQPLRYGALNQMEQKAVRTLIEDISSRIGGEALDLDVGPEAYRSLFLKLGAPARDGSDTFELRVEGVSTPLLQQQLQVQTVPATQ